MLNPKRLEGFLTIEEAAARAHVSTGTIRNWRISGKLQEYTFANAVLIKEEDLDALLKTNPVRKRGR